MNHEPETYAFLWRSETRGASFRRAIDAISPLLLEGRVEATKAGLTLAGVTDALAISYHVPFAEGEAQLAADRTKVVFAVDLKEVSSWLTTLKPNMSFELSLSARDSSLSLKFYNDSKTYEHTSALTNLRLSTDHVSLNTKEVATCQHMLEVSTPALSAIIRHHYRAHSHARFSVTDDGTLLLESCLKDVDGSKKSVSGVGGTLLLDSLDAPAIKVLPADETPSGPPDFFALETLKRVSKAGSTQDRKNGRVVMALNPQGPLIIVYQHEGAWLRFDLLTSTPMNVTNENDQKGLEPLPLTRQVADNDEAQRKIIKRKTKKKAAKREREETEDTATTEEVKTKKKKTVTLPAPSPAGDPAPSGGPAESAPAENVHPAQAL